MTSLLYLEEHCGKMCVIAHVPVCTQDSVFSDAVGLIFCYYGIYSIGCCLGCKHNCKL